MAPPFTPALPSLLYCYPWMPFPRRITIYLHEKQISSTLVKTVRVSDPQDGDEVVDRSFPSRPRGSLPILAVRSDANDEDGKPSQWFHVRQSMAIINSLEELCEQKLYGFDSPMGSLFGRDLMEQVRVNEVLILAEELTVIWNPVRTFGTKAGTMSYPQGAREMLRWVRRPLLAIEKWWQESDRDVCFSEPGISTL
ncbi:uncharacterized protein LTR77_010308 [Saxophila tyrrhenica]|uniref:GST N-terminal domain-containing protein n=1 Tax=Saxophila tyrrhenica TaxID=1690608 RepID=A0AAV9NXF1_9PEZI|nr:hypothetical protein LTR77_010308 [Saxophila tyrrhenica]